MKIQKNAANKQNGAGSKKKHEGRISKVKLNDQHGKQFLKVKILN